MKIIENCDLSKLSHIGIGPVIPILYIAESGYDIEYLLKNGECKVLGNMSNILLADSQLNKRFVQMKGDFQKIEMIADDDASLRAGSGAHLSSLLAFMADNGISGIELLAGIPGTIGAMILMNAGANGVTISDYLIEIDTVEDGIIKKENISFSYRHSGLKQTIKSALFSFVRGETDNIRKRISDCTSRRIISQPFKDRSLGSVFKNPSAEIPAWKLIDDCGFRGKCVNDICVSEKHTNFIINRGRGTCTDFLNLSENIIKSVYEQKKIKLEYEVEILL